MRVSSLHWCMNYVSRRLTCRTDPALVSLLSNTVSHSGPWRGIASLYLASTHPIVVPNVSAVWHARFYEGALPHGMGASCLVDMRP
jgi:hypothetical protein